MLKKPFTPNSYNNYSSKEYKDKLHESIGGEKTIDKLAMMLYIKGLNDPSINRYFAHTNLLAQIMHQKTIISYLLNTPKASEEKDIREAHKDLSIEAAHFDRTIEYLKQSMIELEFDQQIIKQCMEKFAATRNLIVSLE